MSDRELMQQALDALAKIETCLNKANGDGLLTDTIWMTDHETLFDFIANESEALHARLAQQDVPETNFGEIVPADEEQLKRIAKLVEPEPLSYWNAVQGWVELPHDEQRPLAWLYAEGLEALKAGKCWTAYGKKQDDDCCIPVYLAPLREATHA